MQNLTIRLAHNDDPGINCAVCLKDGPKWCYSYRIRLSAARVTAGLCDGCREALAKGLPEPAPTTTLPPLPTEIRMSDLKIERRNTRIWFGEGDQRWSVEDPDFPRVADEFHECTDRKLYYVRGLASTLLYLVATCPTTKRAQEQIALIRRALREVPSPYGDSHEQ